MNGKELHQNHVLSTARMKRDRGLFENPDVLGRTTSQILGPEFLADLAEVNERLKHPVIVECGSGTGRTLADLKRHYPGAMLVGFDLDPDFSLAKQGIDIQRVDVENLLEQQDAVQPNSADLVYSCASYRYFYDKPKFLSEVFELLKIGGKAHIDVGWRDGLVSPGLDYLIQTRSLKSFMNLVVRHDDFGHENNILRMQKNTPKSIDWGISFASAKPESSAQTSPVKISCYE